MPRKRTLRIAEDRGSLALTTDTTKGETSETAFIPRVGWVYELTPSTNVYASWIRGFEPQSVAIKATPRLVVHLIL